MKRIQVTSSNIASIGFDEESSTLEIEFLDGAVYQYFGVPLTAYDGLIYAGSKGKYFAQHIKGYYRYVKL